MRSMRGAGVLTAISLLLLGGSEARADVLVLKPTGKRITCVIQQETSTQYVVRNNLGELKFSKSQVQHVERASTAKNQALLDKWTGGATTVAPTKKRNATSTPGTGKRVRVRRVSDQNFDSFVLQSSNPVIVDFYTTWCAPCKVQAPILARLAQDYRGKVRFVRVDAERSPATASRYSVNSYPTLILFKNGQVVERLSGLYEEPALRPKLDRLSP